MKTKTSKKSKDWYDFIINKPDTSYQQPVTINYPESREGTQLDTAAPLILQSDLRNFWGRTGATTVTDTIYTVPTGYFYYVDAVYKKTDRYVSNVPYLYFEDSSGNEIIRFKTNNTEYDLTNMLPQKIKLIAGDVIKGYYSTVDASGNVSFTIIGIKELDTGQVKVN